MYAVKMTGSVQVICGVGGFFCLVCDCCGGWGFL